MAETKEITQHLQKDVAQNRIISGVALASGVLNKHQIIKLIHKKKYHIFVFFDGYKLELITY